MTCPECGKESKDNTTFCTTCGCELSKPDREKAGRLLILATPPILLAIGVALAWDLGMTNPLETGTGIGLVLSMFFLVCGLGFWIICKTFSITVDYSTHWKAGLFGTAQLIAAGLLALPCQEGVFTDVVKNLTFHDEQMLKLGLVFALYLPTVFIDFWGLTRNPQAGTMPTTGNNPKLSFIELFPSRIPICVLMTTLLSAGILTYLLPTQKREFLLARIAADFGSLDVALEHTNSALKSDEKFAPAYHLKGLITLAQAKGAASSQAVYLMEKAEKLDPNNARYLLGLSLALSQAKEEESALAAASHAVDLKPIEPTLWIHLADLNLHIGNKQAAINAYRHALAISPNDPLALNNMAYTLLETNQDPILALEMAKESVRLQPGFVFNTDTLAWALYKNGQFADAYETLKEIRQIGSMSPEIEFHYTMICKELGVIQNPRLTLEAILAHPDIDIEPVLRNQIIAAIASLDFLPDNSNKPEAASKSVHLDPERIKDVK